MLCLMTQWSLGCLVALYKEPLKINSLIRVNLNTAILKTELDQSRYNFFTHNYISLISISDKIFSLIISPLEVDKSSIAQGGPKVKNRIIFICLNRLLDVIFIPHVQLDLFESCSILSVLKHTF